MDICHSLREYHCYNEFLDSAKFGMINRGAKKKSVSIFELFYKVPSITTLKPKI